MCYEKINFTALTQLTAKNLNHLETIAAEAIPSIDLHRHPDIHFSKTQSDALCFPEASGLDADLIDSISFDDLLGAQIEPGGVMLYYGTDADFENGGYLKASNKWHISDGGTYGSTPTIDMRGFFPRCPNTITGTGTGGHSTITPTGSATLGNHTLTLDEIPSHAHRWVDHWTTSGVYAIGSIPDMSIPNDLDPSVDKLTEYNHSESATPHAHAGASVSFSAITKAPANMALHFLAKVVV